MSQVPGCPLVVGRSHLFRARPFEVDAQLLPASSWTPQATLNGPWPGLGGCQLLTDGCGGGFRLGAWHRPPWLPPGWPSLADVARPASKLRGPCPRPCPRKGSRCCPAGSGAPRLRPRAGSRCGATHPPWRAWTLWPPCGGPRPPSSCARPGREQRRPAVWWAQVPRRGADPAGATSGGRPRRPPAEPALHLSRGHS